MAIELSENTRKQCEEIIGRYPADWKQAAILPVLHAVQQEWGYISLEGLKLVADMLGMPAARAAGVMSFYPMFHKAPVGKYVIHVCSTLSCALNGAEALVDHLKERLRIDVGETTGDGKFTLAKTECIAACDSAPAVMINTDLYRFINEKKMDDLLAELE